MEVCGGIAILAHTENAVSDAKRRPGPPDRLAQLAGYADREQFDSLIGLGGDVNAVDKVGYCALNHGAAFGNRPLMDHIISLGGV